MPGLWVLDCILDVQCGSMHNYSEVSFTQFTGIYSGRFASAVNVHNCFRYTIPSQPPHSHMQS